MEHYECNCECHKPHVRMMHFMECCGPCPFCKLNIKDSFWKSHIKACADKATPKKEA